MTARMYVYMCSLADLCHALVDGTKGVMVG